MTRKKRNHKNVGKDLPVLDQRKGKPKLAVNVKQID